MILNKEEVRAYGNKLLPAFDTLLSKVDSDRDFILLFNTFRAMAYQDTLTISGTSGLPSKIALDQFLEDCQYKNGDQKNANCMLESLYAHAPDELKKCIVGGDKAKEDIILNNIASVLYDVKSLGEHTLTTDLVVRNSRKKLVSFGHSYCESMYDAWVKYIAEIDDSNNNLRNAKNALYAVSLGDSSSALDILAKRHVKPEWVVLKILRQFTYAGNKNPSHKKKPGLEDFMGPSDALLRYDVETCESRFLKLINKKETMHYLICNKQFAQKIMPIINFDGYTEVVSYD